MDEDWKGEDKIRNVKRTRDAVSPRMRAQHKERVRALNFCSICGTTAVRKHLKVCSYCLGRMRAEEMKKKYTTTHDLKKITKGGTIPL